MIGENERNSEETNNKAMTSVQIVTISKSAPNDNIVLQDLQQRWEAAYKAKEIIKCATLQEEINAHKEKFSINKPQDTTL